MKKPLLAAIVAVALLMPGIARPQTVYCENCSNWWDQGNALLQSLEQTKQQIQTVTNTYSLITNAVTNTVSLPTSVYRDLTGDVGRLTGLLQQASMLGGNTQMMLRNLGAAGGYPTSGLTNWRQQFTTENNACSNSITQQANLLDYQVNQLSSDASTLGSLQTEIMGTSGRQQSLQSMGGVLATLGQLVTKLQGTITGASQATVTCQTSKMDRQALLDSYDEQQFKAAAGVSCASLAQFGGSATECSGNGN